MLVTVVVTTAPVSDVGRTAGPAPLSVEDVELGKQELLLPHTRSDEQQPPPRLAAHELKPAAQTSEL